MDYYLNPSMNLLAVLCIATSCFTLVLIAAVYTLRKISYTSSRFSIIIVAFSVFNCLMGLGYCISNLLIKNHRTLHNLSQFFRLMVAISIIQPWIFASKYALSAYYFSSNLKSEELES